eukprot:gene18313-24970_t
MPLHSALSTDACNDTKKQGCAAGGALDMWTADKFFGPWRKLGHLFTTSDVHREFVTSDYIGGLP